MDSAFSVKREAVSSAKNVEDERVGRLDGRKRKLTNRILWEMYPCESYSTEY